MRGVTFGAGEGVMRLLAFAGITLGVGVVGVEGEMGLGSEGSLGILIGVIVTVRRETEDRGVPVVGCCTSCACAVEAATVVEGVL
jgi:hypothetical protein